MVITVVIFLSTAIATAAVAVFITYISTKRCMKSSLLQQSNVTEEKMYEHIGEPKGPANTMENINGMTVKENQAYACTGV